MASAVTCCICLRSITDDKSRKKRKRLHEEHSRELQEVLNKLILETFPSLLGCDLFSFKETSQRDAYICGECRNKLGQVSKLQEQLQKVKNDICQKLSSLHILERGHSTRQKRPIDVPASNSTQVKSARLQTTNTTANIVDDCQAEECDTANQWSVGLSGHAETAANNLVQSQSNVASSPDLFVR